jgi:heat shock protein HslJ
MNAWVKCASVVLIAALAASPAFAQRKKQKEGEGEQGGQSKIQGYEPQFPTKMNWVLSTLNGKTPVAEATMSIDENLRGSGTGGCNTWSATLYPIRGQRLAMGPVAMTRKTCGAAENALERQFLGILHSGPTWSLEGSTLTVKSQGGVLVFNRGL